MSHAITTTTMPHRHVTKPELSRAKSPILNPSRRLPLTRCPQLRLTGGLIGGSGLVARSINGVQNGLPSVDLENNLGLSSFLEIELKVRDYEVDHYGVVNNAVYSNYCQHAHHELISAIGFKAEGACRNRPVAVTNLSFKFISPLRNRDKFVIKVRVSHSTIARVHVEHFMYKLPTYQPILEAKSTLVWLDENHRPVRIPSELKPKLARFGLYK